MFVIPLRGKGYDDASRNILGQPHPFVGESGDIELLHIGKEGVDHIGTRGGLITLVGAGQGARPAGLGHIDHFSEGVPDIGCLFDPVGFGDPCRGPDNHVGQTDLASPVVRSMVSGEGFHQFQGEIIFPAHEYPLPGDKDIVEDDQGLPSHDAVFGISRVELALESPRVVGLPSEDEGQSLCIHGDDEGEGIILILGPHGPGRHGDDFVGVDGAGYVGFRPPYDDSIGSSLNDTQVDVGVILFMRPKAAVPFWVRHCPGTHEVVLLYVVEKGPEMLVIR